MASAQRDFETRKVDIVYRSKVLFPLRCEMHFRTVVVTVHGVSVYRPADLANMGWAFAPDFTVHNRIFYGNAGTVNYAACSFCQNAMLEVFPCLSRVDRKISIVSHIVMHRL